MAVDVIALLGNILLFALVFGMSATVDIDCMRAQVRNGKAICTGIFCQFVVLPFLGFAVVRTLLQNERAGMGITLLVVTSSPGGSYSNWWCSMFNADLALSVTMTAISTILSIVMLPLNLLVYTRFSYQKDVIHNLDWKSLFWALVVVITGIAAGLFCSYRFQSRDFNHLANRCGNIAGLSLIIFSALMTSTGSSDTKIWSHAWTFYVGVTLPCLLGLILANVLATALRLKKPERVTVAIECCYQNVGIATSLALSMFNGNELNEAMGVPFFYGAMEALLVGLYCVAAWKMNWTKAPPSAPFWRVLWTSYEVLEYEQSDLECIEIKISQSTAGDNDASSEESLNREGNVLTTYFNLSDSQLPKWTKQTGTPVRSSVNSSEAKKSLPEDAQLA